MTKRLVILRSSDIRRLVGQFETPPNQANKYAIWQHITKVRAVAVQAILVVWVLIGVLSHVGDIWQLLDKLHSFLPWIPD